METWKRPADIFRRCTVICAKRDGMDESELILKAEELKDRFGARVILMDLPEIPVSSTQIRDLLAKGMSMKYYLDDKVIEYIDKNDLYRR